MKILNLIIFSFVLCVSCGNITQKKEIKKVFVNMQQTDTLQFIGHTDNDFLSVFLDFEYTGKVIFFKEPNGNKIIKFVQNTENDGIVMFKLLQKTDSMYYAIAFSGFDDRILAKGWIYKQNHLGVYSAAYGDKRCTLYTMPSKNAKVVIAEVEYNPDMYEVVDFERDWLKVKIKINGKTYQGWMPPEMQCANPYTTCS